METLNYGDLPDRDSIVAAVDAGDHGHDGGYWIRPCRTDAETLERATSVGIDSHLEAVMWSEIQSGIEIERDSMPVLLRRLTELWNAGDEEAGDLASVILETLDFEWI